MILRIQNPSDSFDQLEVLEFCYRSRKGQVVQKTLTLRAVKFLKTSDSKFVYSDEPPIDIYISDIDAVLIEDAIAGHTIKAEALSKCFEVTAELFTETGLNTTVEEA